VARYTRDPQGRIFDTERGGEEIDPLERLTHYDDKEKAYLAAEAEVRSVFLAMEADDADLRRRHWGDHECHAAVEVAMTQKLRADALELG
jgi:hypothetical protein